MKILTKSTKKSLPLLRQGENGLILIGKRHAVGIGDFALENLHGFYDRPDPNGLSERQMSNLKRIVTSSWMTALFGVAKVKVVDAPAALRKSPKAPRRSSIFPPTAGFCCKATPHDNAHNGGRCDGIAAVRAERAPRACGRPASQADRLVRLHGVSAVSAKHKISS